MSKYKTLAYCYEKDMIGEYDNISDAVIKWKSRVKEIARADKTPLSEVVRSLVSGYNDGEYSAGVVNSAAGYLYAKYFM